MRRSLAILLLVLALGMTSSAVFALDPPNPDTPPPTEVLEAETPQLLTPINVSSGGTIGLLKYLPNDAQVKISGKLVTAICAGETQASFYVEETDRSAGIRVDAQVSVLASVGYLVNVAGTLTTIDGERVLRSAVITAWTSSSSIDPLLMTLSDIGGGPAGYQPGVILRVPTVNDPLGLKAVGINNVGLLVKVYGRVTAVLGDGVFYLDDGSDVYVNDEVTYDNIDGNAGSDVWDSTTHDCGTTTHKNLGVRVSPMCGGSLVTVAEGDFVKVVGIVGTREDAENRVLPVLRPRDTADIIINPDTILIDSASYTGRVCPESGTTATWSMMSLPLPVALGIAHEQYPPSADTLLGSDNYLWAWSHLYQASVPLDCERTSSVDINSLTPRQGYWLRLRGAQSIDYTAVNDDSTDRWVSLPGTELNLFGHPLNHDVLWRDLSVTDGKLTLSIEDAASDSALWMYSEGYWWACDQQGVSSIDITSDYGATTTMRSWCGYNAFTNKPVALIVPGTTLPTTGRGAISVGITDSYSHAPIVGARVYCKYGSTLTGSNGIAEVGVQQPNDVWQLPPGSYLVTASALGYQSKSAVVAVTAATRATTSIELDSQVGMVVDATASPASVEADGVSLSDVSVYVTDAEGAPRSGMTVSLSTTLGSFDNSSNAITLVTDSGGTVRCTLKSSSTGTAAITATCEQISDQEETVAFTTPTGPAVAMPTFDEAGGSYCELEPVKILCATEGASIYYTIDPLENPTEQSIPYDSAGYVVVYHNLTLKARAFKAGCVPSNVAEAQYTVIPECPIEPEWDAQAAQVDVIPAPPVGCIGVTEIKPGCIRIDWRGGPYFETYEVVRVEGTVETTIAPVTSQTYWIDNTCPMQSGTTYTYKVRRLTGENEDLSELGLPDDPEDDVYHHQHWSIGEWSELPVTVMKVPAWQNQTVDTRVDMRCADNRLMNFNFGDLTYRGGLFVGGAQDPARTARSFLQFNFAPQMPSTDMTVLAGSVNAYSTGLLKSAESPTVGSHFVANDSWSDDTLDWSSSLALLPENAGTPRFTDTIGAAAGWHTWPMYVDIVKQVRSDRVLSVGLARTEEKDSLGWTHDGKWAYFAKSQYEPQYEPVVLYAYGPQVPALEFSVSPNPMKGGRVATGTVTLANEAPAGGVKIDIGLFVYAWDGTEWKWVKTYDAVAPPDITIPEGETTGTFPISTYPVGTQTDIRVKVYSCPRVLEQTLRLLHY